jgi:hypothetical protein
MSSPETYINPQSRPTTRSSPRHPRLSPRHPRPPRVRHCALRKSGAGSRLIETGRPRTCSISAEESYPSTEPKLSDWRGAPRRSSCWGTRRSSTTAAPQASSSDAYPSSKARSSCKKYTWGLAVVTPPRALVGNAFRQGFYWPTAVADATRIVRTCQGCQFYARQTHLPAQALQTIPITWLFAVWGLDLVGPL